MFKLTTEMLIEVFTKLIPICMSKIVVKEKAEVKEIMHDLCPFVF